jgi:sugar phosphate isomerase/epimerase
MKTNLTRRDFLRLSAAGTIGTLVLPQYSCRSGSPAIADPKTFGLGLQLYTIRDAMAMDVPGSLKKVSDIGYKYLELADYSNGRFYGFLPSEFKKMVNDLGMEILSSHTQVEAEGITLDNAKTMADDHAKIDVKYCIQPWVVEEARTISSYQKMVADWNTVGEIMKQNGIQFGYHNHNFEFVTMDGKVPFFDIFMAELDKELVTIELDLFWTTKAGYDPVDVINRYPGRFQLFHMKDMFTHEEPFFTTDGVNDFAPVGEGVIDFERILAVRETAGMKYMIVEQDSTKDGMPFDAIQKSITNLTTRILT